jgi:hypothetical protein
MRAGIMNKLRSAVKAVAGSYHALFEVKMGGIRLFGFFHMPDFEAKTAVINAKNVIWGCLSSNYSNMAWPASQRTTRAKVWCN